MTEPVKQVRPKRKKRLRNFVRSLSQNRFVLAATSRLAIWYLNWVERTNKIVVEPENILDTLKPQQPLIVGVWHGQHILMPALPIGLNASAMISRNFDGEVTARIVEHYGNRTIRASGGRNQKQTLKKGGMIGFLEMLNALKGQDNVVQTADIPKGIARRAGLGIIQLGKKSGAPIVPLAIASSRRYVFQKSWDKTTINLPYGTTGIVVGKLVHVPEDADDATLEACRETLENELKYATRRAYELCGKPE
jgi:lysophospholipid acyltransferase (LPLAT)-like uncharacterized protein